MDFVPTREGSGETFENSRIFNEIVHKKVTVINIIINII